MLEDAGVPAGPVYDAPSIAKDEHYLARGMIQTHEVVIEDEPELVRFPGSCRISRATRAGPWLGPDLGEHTDEVLREIAGSRRTRSPPLCHRHRPRRCARCRSRSPTSSSATACRTSPSSPRPARLESAAMATAAGVRRLEVATFVNPKRVPQMAGAEDVLAGIKDRKDGRRSPS